MTRVVGLTGGIGTGKSTVGRLLSALGAVVIDSDAIVHELQAPGTPLLARIAESFGAEMIRPDGSLDRARLGQLVFGDAAARQRLDELVHPVVGARRCAASKPRGPRARRWSCSTSPCCSRAAPPAPPTDPPRQRRRTRPRR